MQQLQPGRFANKALEGLTYPEYYRVSDAVDRAPKPLCVVCNQHPQSGIASQKGRYKGLCWVCRRLYISLQQGSSVLGPEE
jgi:hypothetical protein